MNATELTMRADVAAAGGWYAGLIKPAWNPPAWLFGPAWTVLYVAMAAAAWLVWRQGGWRSHRVALALFALQLLFNLVWSPLFFRMHRPGWALLDCALLAVSLAATLAAFWRIDRRAGALLVPYLAWVCFATFLNFTIWRLNRDAVSPPSPPGPAAHGLVAQEPAAPAALADTISRATHTQQEE